MDIILGRQRPGLEGGQEVAGRRRRRRVPTGNQE